MSVIRFKEANCKNCYKCIRNCPVKAIAFNNDQAEIAEEECMLCGNCLAVCPQNAKSVRSDIDSVKGFINKKEKVYASIAPSFIAAFPGANERSIFAALKRLGFAHVEETAVGAVQVSKQYEKLLDNKTMKNIITTACPSIVLLVEKHYPELIDLLAPVVSPMIAHAKMLRKTYGPRIRVVFIGPCISKKEECKDSQNAGAVDAVISFEELKEWIESEGISMQDDFSEEIKASKEKQTRIYPIPGGILRTIDNSYKKYYRCISIDGVDQCISTLDAIKNDGLEGYFIEMNSCSGGCIGGPGMRHLKGGLLAAREKLIDFVKRAPGTDMLITKVEDKINFSKKFFDRSHKLRIPTEAVMQEILNSIGKYTKDKELNCSACGYPTCRDKAVAVYNNKAQLQMCLPYMRERAESISNLIINTTPNAIFALDRELKIQEINMCAQRMFSLNKKDMVGKSIDEVLDCEDFVMVLEKNGDIFDKKHYYSKYDMTVEQSIIYVSDQNIVIAIIKDISDEERKRQRMYEIRSENVEIAQNVIEKQMRVAQEIASLLGETTAETKVALTKLKKSIIAEMSEVE